MKRLGVLLAGLLAVAAIAGPSRAANKPAKDVVVSGEVVDLTCFSLEGKKATGADHKECAAKCINGGGPVGLLLKNGTVLLVVAADHGDTKGQLVGFAGQQVKLTGHKMSVKGGMSVFHFSKVEAAM